MDVSNVRDDLGTTFLDVLSISCGDDVLRYLVHSLKEKVRN